MNGGDVVSLELEKEGNPPDLRHARSLLTTNRELGRTQLKRLAAGGSAMSAYFLALSDRPEPAPKLLLDETSEHWLKEASRLGSNLACYRLGWLYMRAKRYEESLAAFGEGVQSGYPPAFRMLAMHYKHGLGVTPNVRTALDLLEKGSSLGSLRARLELAHLLLQKGSGVIQKLEGLRLLFSSFIRSLLVYRKHGYYSIELV